MRLKFRLLSMLLCMALLLTACGSKAATASESADVSVFGSDAALMSTAETDTAAEDQTAAEAPAAEQSAVEDADVAQPETTAESTEAPETSEDPGIAFPYTLDEGRLVVNSVFQSSAPNPDCNDEEGEDIATLEIVNQSGQYLDAAAYTVTLTDGEVFSFETDAIPDGKTVWAFELSNQSCDLQPAVASITCTAYYLDSSPMLEDAVSVAVDGTTAAVTSLSGDDLTDLRVGFHSVMDGIYFGGLALSYEIDELPAGSSTSLEVTGALFGDAEAVYVLQGEA